MTKEKKQRRIRVTAIGTVTVTKPAASGSQVLVKVTATSITVPFGSPSVCNPGPAQAIIYRKSGSNWVFESGPQTMSGNIATGFDTTFGPRPNGDFKAEVNIIWQISHPETKDGFS